MRTDVDKPFASTDAPNTASQSFGDPSRSFGAGLQGFEDHSHEFAERAQDSEVLPQSSDARPQSSDVQSKDVIDRPQNYSQRSQSYSERSHSNERSQQNYKTSHSQHVQHRETVNARQNTQQSSQHGQYSRNFQPYAQQQQMYERYQDYRQQHPDTSQILPEHARFRALGGWLLLFVLAAIFGIFVNLVFSVRIINRVILVGHFIHLLPDDIYRANTINLVSGIVMLSLTILQTAFVVSILGRKPTFLRIEQITYILLCLTQIGLVVSANMAGALNPGAEAFELVARAFGAIIMMIIMTAYYSRSMRVRVYMGSDEFKKKALFSFKPSPLWPY